MLRGGFDSASFKEGIQVRGAEAEKTADLVVGDPPFRHQAPDVSLAHVQMRRGLLESERLCVLGRHGYCG